MYTRTFDPTLGKIPRHRTWTRSALRNRARLLIGNTHDSQGRHVDPEAEPRPPRRWQHEVVRRHDNRSTPPLDLLADALVPPDGGTPREGVLDDLSRHYGLTVDDCLRACLDWEAWSVEEWKAADRSDGQGLRDFYRELTSWSFDLLWYAYLQAEGYALPMPVLVADFLAEQGLHQGVQLDFGSGVGVTSQVFDALGWDTVAADVADRLLAFAEYRLQRRGARTRFVNLNEERLDIVADAITAFDVLAHVPDLDATVRELHSILRPGGWLFATFDARPGGTDTSAWHLYDEEWDMCWRTERVGFVQRAALGTIRCYQRVEPGTHRLAKARAAALHANPVLLAGRRAARQLEQRLRQSPDASS